MSAHRGGAREGAGAKPKGALPMGRYNVMLDAATVEILRELGERNLSAGVRAAAAHAIDGGSRHAPRKRGDRMREWPAAAPTYHAPKTPKRKRRRQVDPVAEKNREIFEARQAEIRKRLAAGEKPNRIAAWLNSLGFVSTGATLNWFLK